MSYKLTKNQLGAIQMDLNGQSVPDWMIAFGTQDTLVWWRFEVQHCRDLIALGRYTPSQVEEFLDEQEAA